MKTLILLTSLCFVIFSNAFVSAEEQKSLPPVTTVPKVDLQQYLGKWYEIATIPKFFEKQCVRNTSADYAIAENNLISVINSCDTSSGQRSIATGRAKVVDNHSNSKLKVTFVNFFGWNFFFGGDYWILALGDNYSYAVIGAPGRDYAWILSRTPELPQEQLRAAAKVLKDQGYDTCLIITSIQAGGIQSNKPLCQIASAD
jgi:apolipoprotein D and lipocalin family protein